MWYVMYFYGVHLVYVSCVHILCCAYVWSVCVYLCTWCVFVWYVMCLWCTFGVCVLCLHSVSCVCMLCVYVHVVYVCVHSLVCTKVLTSILLLGWSCHLLESAQEDGHQTDPCNIDSQVLAKKDVSSRDTPAKERNASEKNSPQKRAPDRGGSSGQSCTPVESLSGNFAGFRKVEGDVQDRNCNMHSISDSLVDSQPQSFHRESSPVKASLTEELFTFSDGWEAESEDSDSEFHSSLDDSVSAQTKTTLGTPIVDYDEEKKYK